MRQRRWWIACVGLVSAFNLGGSLAQGAVTYVDASVTNTVGAASGLVDWNSGNDVTNTPGALANDGLWRWRGDQGSNGVWEASGSTATIENAVELKTSVMGLVNGLYDVFVFYDSSTGGDWPIRAGLTSNPGMNQIYDRSGATPGAIAGLDPFSGPFALTFEVTPPNAGAGQTMRYANLGQVNVTGGALSIFVDDLPATSSGNRTWYEGMGYQLASSGPPTFTSVMSGLASSGSTWNNGQPPISGANYHVLSGHTVTVDYTSVSGGSPFPGNELRVLNGGAVTFNASEVYVPLLVVEQSGSLTESVSGDFALGDISAPTLGILHTSQDLNFDIDTGANFFLDMTLQGQGNLNFNSATGSQLWLSAASGHLGTIRFNGSGDRVILVENQTFGTLEMNSTGANTVYYNPTGQADTGTLIFNQPGTIDHAATQTSPVRRLHGVNFLEANATVTVDLSKGFPDNSSQTEERRYLVASGMRGAGDVNVNGTAVDYSNLMGVSLNEFEVGSTGNPTTVPVSTYSGTLTGNNFVNIEIRQHFRDARFVVANNARLEMGHQALVATHSIEMGEIVVNSGGILEVGFEQSSSTGVPGHHIYQLTLIDNGSRDGSLTINSGGTLRMQVNGTEANQFDTILADGNVQLGGTLNVLVNPGASSGGGGTAANPLLTPSIGQTFDIIKIAPGPAPAGDYDGNGTVDNADYGVWRAQFGTNNAAADGNANGIVDAADYVLWRENFGATGGTNGTITGAFSNVVVTDFDGAMSGFGFKVNYSSALVQLEVIAGGAGAISAVPEPATQVLLAMLLPLWAIRRQSRCQNAV